VSRHANAAACVDPTPFPKTLYFRECGALWQCMFVTTNRIPIDLVQRFVRFLNKTFARFVGGEPVFGCLSGPRVLFNRLIQTVMVNDPLFGFSFFHSRPIRRNELFAAAPVRSQRDVDEPAPNRLRRMIEHDYL